MHWLCLTSRALCMHSPAFPVTPVDTTGAGDLFASGFLHAYLEGYSLEQCARLGALAGGERIPPFFLPYHQGHYEFCSLPSQ